MAFPWWRLNAVIRPPFVLGPPAGANHDATTMGASNSPIDIVFGRYDPGVDTTWDVAED